MLREEYVVGKIRETGEFLAWSGTVKEWGMMRVVTKINWYVKTGEIEGDRISRGWRD